MCEIIVTSDLVHLRNERISYAIAIVEGGIPMHLYFGKRLEAIHPQPFLRRAMLRADGAFSMQECTLDRLPQEYPSFGLGDWRRGALTVCRGDGTRSCDLRVVSTETVQGKPTLDGLPATFGENCRTLKLHLSDALTGLRVTLLYTVFEDCDAIARSALIENGGTDTLELENAMSLCLDLPDSRYDLLTLSGAWARERNLVRRPLMRGYQGVESRYGASSLVTSPFLALLRPEATEDAGDVYGAALVYSGNFTAEVSVGSQDSARMLLGISDFAWKLAPGECFQTPEALLTYSPCGLNGMSVQFHRLCDRHLTRGDYAHRPRPILINNWEATYFDFDEEKLLTIARTAADVGIELFVLDDGWFGHRDDDTTSLGDWQVDKRKLPDGMDHLIAQIHALGMRFGLWFEPEMISPESDLYRAHPDWCIHIAGRERIEKRHQLILDLSRADVCEHVYHAVADMLRAHTIDYVKWDMNRNFTNIGSALLPPDRQRELPHRYMLGLYGVLERLVREFPHVLFESCSSGGGRFDLGMLHYMPQTWCSDNTDALCRCRIQYGTSLVFPPHAMGAHVSAVPNHQTGRVTPLAARFGVALGGAFGYEMDLNRLTPEELNDVRNQVKQVKALRDWLFDGTFYRLCSPFEDGHAAWMIVSADKSRAMVMVLRAQGQVNNVPPQWVVLRGLKPASAYRIADEVYGGDELMQIGLCCELPVGDAACRVYTLSEM